MLSSALREYVKYRGKAPVVDKIKELERSLIGKNVGVDFFPTPKPVAEQMVRDAGITEGMKVLEPSAGNGNIADAIRAAGVKPDVVEISSSLRELLQAKGYNVVEHNFMDYNEGGYDAIVMNPPFGGGADIEHVRHAYDLLKPGGKIVAIMGEGAFFRSDRKASDFRDWLEEVNGSEEKLPQNTFQDKTLMNTTGVNARIVNITKPESSALFQRKEQSQIYTTEFKAWFGDWENDSENASKVVDESGKPLVVYHGTDKNFTEFRTGLNKVKGEQGMFFSTNPEIASKYSGYDELFPSKNIGSVKPVYLNIEKLKTVDLKGGKYGRAEIINKAKEEGFDGILLKNHYDAGGVQDQYVVFSPNQIKSATGNTGVFNPSNPDIRFQRGEQSPNDTQFHRSGRPTLSTEQPGKTADPFQFGAISALAKAAANQGVSIGPENIQVVDAAPQSAGFIGLAQRVFDVPIKTIKLTREAQKLSDMFNGFRHNGVVYLNDSSTDPSVYVVMHEVLHDIFAKQPYLKTRLMDFFQKQFTDSGNAAALREAEWYRSLMKSKELTQGMKDIGVEEVIANYLADSSTDPKFWDAVHAYSQPLARRLLQKIAEVIDRILRAAKVYRRTSEGWFKDAQAVRGEMVKMMAAAVRGASREEFYGAVREALFMRDGSGQQQDQTRTAEFKRWFGDWENDPENASKVVDENGKPLVVYRGEHGKVRTKVRTTHLVPTTDEKSLLEEIGDVPSSLIQTALGSVSFVNNPETAATYAESPNNRELSKTAEQPRVIPAYLSIRNPVIQNLDDPFVEMGDIVKAIGIDKAIKIAIKHSYQIELTNNWDENFSEKYSSVEELLRKSPKRIKELYLDAYFVFDDIDAVRYFKDAGYDGAIHMGNGESMDDIEYKVFSTTQIKSATGNTGAFDPSNPDIRYQRNNNTLNDQNARTLAAEYGLSFVGMQEGVPGYPGTALFNDKNGNTFAARTESELESRVSEMTDGVLFQRPIADTFYSPTLKAVQALKQDRGTGDQFFAMISKAPGVKESEWKWMGLDDFLKGKQSVTKKEIEDFVRQNQVTVQEKYNKQGDKKIPFEGLSDEEVAEHYENYMDQEIPLGATRQELIDEMVEANENDMGGERAEVETKYQQYTLPGGENYREVLLTLPLKVVRPATEKSFKVVENGYKSSHWEEPNVIAHTRLDDRTGPNGEKVLFVEEIQSDWARDVRDKGVRQNPVNELPSDYTFNEVVVKEAPNGWSDTRIDVKDGSGNIVWKEYNGTIESAKKNALIDLNHNMKLKGVPNQPFLKNWQELTLKRILRMAAEEGYNRVAWINGEQTADRYNLAKVAESINHSKNADGTYNFHVTDKIGRDILDRMNVPESELAGIFGKDVANKIVNRDGEFDKRRDYSFFTNRGSAVGEVFKDGRWYIKWQDGSESGTYLSKEDAAREADHVTRNYVLSPEHNRPKILKGTDLKIGGEWAHNLYDVQIPKFFEKYGKKWGTKVEPVSLGRDAMPMPTQDKYRGGYFITQDGPHFDTIEEAREWSIKNSPTQQSITITDEMRDSVMHEGQPLFARRKQELLPDGSVPKKKYVSTKLRRPKAEQIAAQEQIEDLTQYIKDRFKVPDIEGVTEERRPLFEKHWDNIATRAELEKELMQYEMYSDAVNFKYHHEGLIKKELKRKEIQQKIYDYARKINLVGEPRNQVDTLMLRTTGTSRNFFKALNIMDTVMEKRLQAKALEEVRLKFDATRKRIAAARAGRQPAPWTAEHTEAVEKYLDQFMFMSAKEEKAYEEAMASLEQNKENFDPEDALGYDSKELAALTEMVKKNLLGMSSSDLLNVMAELTQIERTGKTAKMLADAQAAAKLASDGFFAGVEIRRVTKNSEKSLAERSLGRKERGLARNAKEFFMDTMDPQRVIEWITGNFTEAGRREASVFKQNTWNKLRDASVKSVDSMIKATKHIREIHKPLVDAMKSLPLKYAIKAEFTDGVNDRKIPLPGRVETHELTLNEMMFVYANSKNEGNILHLFGSGWTREGMLQVENTIPEVAKDVVDKMHRYYDVVQYPKMNGVFRRLFGIDMPRIENYFPIRNLLSAKVEDSMLSEMLARFSNKSSVQKGMTKARQGSAAPFREMDYMGVVFANLRQSEHFVANAEAVRDVRKFLNYDDVAQALANRDKDFDAKAWSNDFLKRMAYGKVEAIRSDAVAKTADALRYYYSCYALGWNPKTWVKQWSSLFVGGKYVENKARLAQSALKMMAQRGNMIEDIKSKSLFMKNRNSRFEREIQEMFDKHESTMFLNTTAEVMNKIRQVSMWGISTSDMISSSILWDAKYTEEINKGIPQEQAVRNADEAIEKSFAGGGLAYLTRGQTSQGLTRYLTMFTSDLAKAMNTQYETMRTARQNGLSKTAIAVMMTSLIPAALIFTVDTFDPEKFKDDPEGFLGYILSQIYGAFPLFNQIGDGLYKNLVADPIRKLRGAPTKPLFQGSSSIKIPWMDIADELYSAAGAVKKAIGTKEGDDVGEAVGKAVKASVGAAGMLTGLLPRQPINTAQAAYGLITGTEDDWRRLLYSAGSLKDMSISGGVARGILGNKEISAEQYGEMSDAQREIVDQKIQKIIEKKERLDELKYSRE
jgi:predicted RNA methylase